jgi:hypothetical protein
VSYYRVKRAQLVDEPFALAAALGFVDDAPEADLHAARHSINQLTHRRSRLDTIETFLNICHRLICSLVV